jgi:hypothetical protein
MMARGRAGPLSLLAVLSVLGLVLGACGVSSPSGGTTTTVPSKAADLALARKGLLVLSDFPSGWKASGKISSGNGSNSGVPGAKLAACIGVSKAVLETNWPTENSPSFADPTGAESASDQVEAFPDAAQARTDFANPKTPGCLATILGPAIRQQAQAGGGSGVTVGSITASRLSTPAVGDESGEMELQVPIGTANGSTTLFVTLLIVIQGRLETTLTLTSPGSAFQPALAQQAASAAARHMS